MTNWYGLGVASFVCVILPIWIIGMKLIPMKLKLLFSVVGLLVCWWAVENGGMKRGIFTK